MLKKKKQAAPADETPEEIEEAEEEETTTPPAKRKSSPLRLVLLLLLILLLCCGGFGILGPRLGLPGMGGGQPVVVPPPAGETPAAGETTVAENPPAGETPAAGETTVAENPPAGETPAAGETTVAEQPQPTTEGQLPPAETPSAEQPTVAPEGEQPPTGDTPTQPEGSEATVVPTTLVVPIEATVAPSDEQPDGSQPTTEPADSAADCSTNTPPSAQATGPNEAMMGKGLAVAVFDGTTSTDPDGTIASYSWDFGDNQQDSGDSVTHGYAQVGNYAVTLTVTDNCGATSQSSLNVTVTGPTPPAMTPVVTATVEATPVATSTVQATPVVTATAVPMPVDGTIGFCHLVRRGQTLYGIAAHYGIDWGTLAAVNDVWPNYHVRTGQSLFIPTGDINDGPHLYQADEDETLYDIAYQCGLQVGYLADANNLSVDEELAPGQMIVVPLWH